MARGEHNSGKGGGGFKLFGVEINLEDDIHTASSSSSVSNTVKKKRSHVGEEVECMRKSKSMGNLHEICNREEIHGVAANGGDDSGYHSDDVLHVNSGRAAHGRKKGTPWTASEHRSFLLGLNKLGKGDWKGISKNYVPTRTPTQVASHAQKYFIRMTAAEKKNRRASLFDIPYEEKELHSPPHASSAASFNASEGSQQVNTTSAGDPLKKNNENRGLDGISAHIAASEKKPPLSPATRTYVPDTCHIPYMVGVPGQSFPAAHVMPQTEAYPMLNYQYASYYYVPNNGNIPAPMMTQTPNGLFLQPRPVLHGPPQAHPVTPLAGNIDAVKGPTTSFTTYAAPFHIQYRTPAGPSTSTAAKKEDLETGVGALSL